MAPPACDDAAPDGACGWLPRRVPIRRRVILLRPSSQAPAPYTESLAILPIVNQSGDPELEYVSDGITESLINSMSQLPRLKVIARTTAFRYKGRNIGPRSRPDDELNVRRVFTGRLVRQGDSMGVQVDLINVADGSQVWGYHYDQKLSDLVDVGGEHLRQDIGKPATEAERVRTESASAGGRTENQEAFRLYLLGRYYWNQRPRADTGTVEKAIGYFQQAIEKDPLYALAYVGDGGGVRHTAILQPIPAREAALKGKAAARKALEIDPKRSRKPMWRWLPLPPTSGTGLKRAKPFSERWNSTPVTRPRISGTQYTWRKWGGSRKLWLKRSEAYELDPLSPLHQYRRRRRLVRRPAI